MTECVITTAPRYEWFMGKSPVQQSGACVARSFREAAMSKCTGSSSDCGSTNICF